MNSLTIFTIEEFREAVMGFGVLISSAMCVVAIIFSCMAISAANENKKRSPRGKALWDGLKTAIKKEKKDKDEGLQVERNKFGFMCVECGKEISWSHFTYFDYRAATLHPCEHCPAMYVVQYGKVRRLADNPDGATIAKNEEKLRMNALKDNTYLPGDE